MMLEYILFNEESKMYGVVGRASDGRVVIARGFTPRHGEVWLCKLYEKRSSYVADGVYCYCRVKESGENDNV